MNFTLMDNKNILFSDSIRPTNFESPMKMLTNILKSERVQVSIHMIRYTAFQMKSPQAFTHDTK